MVNRCQNVFYIITLCVVLTGCCSRYADHSVNYSEFEKGNKSILITKVEHKYEGLVWNGAARVKYSFAKADNQYADKDSRHAYRIDHPFVTLTGCDSLSSSYDILMVDPGVYVLEKINFKLGDTEYSSIYDGVNPGDEKFVYGGFSVEPAEIIYLGDLNIKTKSGDFALEINDNYDKAVEYFNTKYPEFCSVPVKKMFFCSKCSMKSYAN